MNRKTATLIIFLTFLVFIFIFLKYFQSKKQSPVLLEPTPFLNLLTIAPTKSFFISPPPLITPLLTPEITFPPIFSSTPPIEKPTYIPTLNPLIKKKVIGLLPVTTDEYLIEYFPASDKFVVSIIKEPYEENVLEVENWFKSNGVNPKSVKIFWSLPRVAIPE